MGMVHVIPELLQKAYRAEDGDVLPVYSVDHRRAFCHVADAVEMLRLLIESDLDGVTLNLGHEEEELAIGELAEKVAATVGRSLQIEALPATPGSPPRRCPDMTRMQELTGYRARIDVDEGLRRTFAWYRENVFEGSGRSAL